MCYRVSNPRYERFCQIRRSPGTTQPVRRLARGRLGFGLAALAPPKDRGFARRGGRAFTYETSRPLARPEPVPNAPRARPRGEATLVVCYNRQGGGKGEESKLQQQNSAKRPASLLLVHHGGVGPGEHARERRLERERPVLARRPASRAVLRHPAVGGAGIEAYPLSMFFDTAADPPLLSNSPKRVRHNRLESLARIEGFTTD